MNNNFYARFFLILIASILIFNEQSHFSIAAEVLENPNIGETIVYTVGGRDELSEKILKNLHFTIYDYLVDFDSYENYEQKKLKGVSLQKFTDGMLKGEDGPARITNICFGTMNEDSRVDAVSIILFSTTGNGYNHYLSIIVPEGIVYKIYQTELFYFKIKIESVEIRSNRVFLTILYNGPDDPTCCPTQKGTLGFKLEGNKIVETKKIHNFGKSSKYLN
jgi:hypothetical protein